jgi:hypothetical protein
MIPATIAPSILSKDSGTAAAGRAALYSADTTIDLISLTMPPPLPEVVVVEETEVIVLSSEIVVVAEELDGVALNPEVVLELVEPVWALVAGVMLILSCWGESKLD